jgi:excisionase family DNA binding protein
MKSSNDLTVPQAARQLKVTLKCVYDLVYAGKLEAEKVAGRWRIPAQAVEARLKRRSA